MNKTNKYLNIALRCGIIASFVLSIVSFGLMLGGLKNIDTNGLDKDNFVERFLAIINDMTGAAKVYIIVMIVLGITLILSVITRYKARLVSLVFRTLTLLICFVTFFGGLRVANALNTLGTYSDLNIVAHNKDTLIESLTANGVTAADVTKIADDLTDKDSVAMVLAAYMIVPLLLFILICTSIHCLAKRKDPNGVAGTANNAEEEF